MQLQTPELESSLLEKAKLQEETIDFELRRLGTKCSALIDISFNCQSLFVTTLRTLGVESSLAGFDSVKLRVFRSGSLSGYTPVVPSHHPS